MSEASNSVISISKAKSELGDYFWRSPCLRPVFYNPFIVSALILIVIWTMDFIYGKVFRKKCGPSTYVQHIVTSYALISIGLCMNNMLLRYRMKKKYFDQKKETESITATYASDDE